MNVGRLSMRMHLMVAGDTDETLQPAASRSSLTCHGAVKSGTCLCMKSCAGALRSGTASCTTGSRVQAQRSCHVLGNLVQEAQLDPGYEWWPQLSSSQQEHVTSTLRWHGICRKAITALSQP